MKTLNRTKTNPKLFFTLCLALAVSTLGASPEAIAKLRKATHSPEAPARMQVRKAIISTSEGDITVSLFADKAPKTVENFIGLATGKKEWKHPNTQIPVKGKSLYEGTTFHRVIPGFMIQGGDPAGNGTGGPGYQFQDEATSDQFDRPGILAMANAGPNTNGSQFFITLKDTTWLNGKHTIFGEVTKDSMKIVEKISKVQTGSQDMPVKPVVIKKIKILG